MRDAGGLPQAVFPRWASVAASLSKKAIILILLRVGRDWPPIRVGR
jgi:hypothetical protein